MQIVELPNHPFFIGVLLEKFVKIPACCCCCCWWWWYSWDIMDIWFEQGKGRIIGLVVVVVEREKRMVYMCLTWRWWCVLLLFFSSPNVWCICVWLEGRLFTIVMHCYWHGVELIVIWEIVFLHFFDCLLFIIVNDKFSFEWFNRAIWNALNLITYMLETICYIEICLKWIIVVMN